MIKYNLSITLIGIGKTLTYVDGNFLVKMFSNCDADIVMFPVFTFWTYCKSGILSNSDSLRVCVNSTIGLLFFACVLQYEW